MIYVFLAEGFEEIEAVTPIDLLRRAGQNVSTVGIGGREITGRSGITFIADIELSEIKLSEDLKMIILPGGMPGVDNLYASERVREAIEYCARNEIHIGAICAAPSILGRMGLLKGKRVTCYPGFEKYLEGAEIIDAPAVAAGTIITGRGAGTSFQFTEWLLAVFCDLNEVKTLMKTIQWNA
jgi:4-methyl-5(b-hydroxyethyl)-thiazole monophosphate biosynthesis